MIKNDKQLEAVMLKDLERFMKNKSQEILERWRDLLVSNWYNAHDESEYYSRTYEFLTSLTSTGLQPIPHGFEVLIFFDTDTMNIKPNGGFIQHAQRDILPTLIEEGYSVFGKKYYDGAHAFAELIQELEDKNYFLDDLRREFGVNVKLKFK